MKTSYLKPSGLSLVFHILLLYLLGLLAGRMVSTESTITVPPMPIEVEIEPSKLINMGNGTLHFASNSSPPSGAKRVAAAKAQEEAVEPAPKQMPSDPAPAKAPTSVEEAPPPLPGEINEASVAVPQLGNSITAGSGSSSGSGNAIGSGNASGGGGKGGTGTGTSLGKGDSLGDDSEGPGFRSGTLPEYPSSARKAGKEGIVTVRVLVGTDGKPVSMTVRVSSGRKDFDTAALNAVKQWLFSPAHRGKDPVASFHDVRVRFRLDEAQ
jgi:periplasmic protein TonB